MNNLEQAARLALDALIEMTQPQRTASESDRYKRVKAAMTALESALAQQAEPVAEPDITAMFCLAQTFTDWNRQHSPPPVRVGFEIAVFAEAAKRIIAQQQAEPVVMQYIALCDAMRYSERKDELTSPEEHAESLVAEIERLKQAEPVAESKVTWGVDWGRNGDENCVAIIKKLPNGDIEVVAIERNPAKPQADPTEGNPSY